MKEIKTQSELKEAFILKQESYDSGDTNTVSRLKRNIAPVLLDNAINSNQCVIIDLSAYAMYVSSVAEAEKQMPYWKLSSSVRIAYVRKLVTELNDVKVGQYLVFNFARSLDIKTNDKEELVRQISGNILTYVKYVLNSDKFTSKRPMCDERHVYAQLITT